jgi:hypothetical protein
MKNIFTIFCLACIMLMSCGSTMILVNKKPIEVEWIVGLWKHKDKEVYEKWVKLSDTEYKGLLYNLDACYATIMQTMRIFSKGPDDWYYEATLKEINAYPVLFKWIPDPVIALKFTNEKNSFPQIVQYNREAFDVMSLTSSNMAGDSRLVVDYSRYITQ